MKQLKLMLLAFACTLSTQAQEQAGVSQVVDSLCHYYNQANYKAIHNMLTNDFKKMLGEEQLSTFYTDHVKTGFGQIQGKKYLKDKLGAGVYVLQMEKGNMKLTVYADGGKIAGMQWLPYEERANQAASAKSKAASDNPLKTPLDLAVDSAVAEYMSQPNACGLSIGVYKNGKFYFYNYGECRRGAKKLPSENSIYQIGSITKTFTGLLLAQAVLDKKIELDDDIRKYLPEKYPNLQYKGQPILVKHLANHTSRIPTVPADIDKQPNFDELDPYKNYSRQMIFNALKSVQPDTLPGTLNEYSNMGMALLGLILEKAYAKSYAQLVAQYITSPLNLKNTSLKPGKALSKKLCAGYNEAGNETPYWQLNDFAPAGGIYSGTAELLEYFVANLKEKLPNMRPAHEASWLGPNYSVGLAWHIIKTKAGHSLVWHNGGTYGFSSFGGFLKEKDCALVVLSNTGSNTDAVGLTILRHLQK